MWEYLKAIYLIATRQNDWALLVASTNPHKALTIHDGCLDGIKLPICFMRMAQAIGDRESYLEAAYIASKDAIPVLANHAIGEYMAQYDETVLKDGKEAYCLDVGIGEYGCEIRHSGSFLWKDFMDAWYEVPGASQGPAGLRLTMWSGVLLSPETFDLQSQFMTEYTRKSVFQSIPQHVPDWYYPNMRWMAFKYLMIRHVLGETTEDFVRYFKSKRYWGAHFAKGLPVYAALQGRDAPCYLVAWEPNRLIQGTYSFKTNKASFEIQAAQPGKVQLKSFVVPQRIMDNGKILSKDMWKYNDSWKLLDITIRERGSHKFILDYPEWRIPKRERPFPEYTVLPPEGKMRPGVSPVKYPANLGKGLTLYLDFEESLEANASKGSGSPLKPLKDPHYVQGIKGKGLKLDIERKRPLAYDANGNLSFRKGTISFWLKPEHEPELIEKIREELAEEYESRGKDPDNYYFSARILWTNLTRLANMNVTMSRGKTAFVFRFFSCRKGVEIKHVTMFIPIAEMGLNAKEPTHIAATWDGDGKRMTEFCVYADGRLVGRRDCKEEETVYEVQKFLDYSDMDINIGGWSSNFVPKNIFNRVRHHMKKIGYTYDELRIYDRALSAQEVKALRDFDRQ